MTGVPYRDVIGMCRNRPLEMVFQLRTPSPATPARNQGDASAVVTLTPAVETPGASAIPAKVAVDGDSDRNARSRALAEFYAEVDPSKGTAANVRKLLAQYEFDDLVGSLRKKYGRIPKGWEVNPNSRHAELTAFYQKHEPAKVAEVAHLLENYKFEDIVDSLQRKVRIR